VCKNTTIVTTDCVGHEHEAILTLVVVNGHHAGLTGETEENVSSVRFSGGHEVAQLFEALRWSN
jgi:hypothetical protein